MRKKLLTNGSAFKRTDDRWGGTVWFMDERGEMTDYIAEFNQELLESDKSKKPLQESMQHWLEVFKFPSVERSTYDRCECTAKHQIYPTLGDKIVSDVTAADIKDLLNQKMQEGYAYTTVKKVYVILGEYFRYLTQQEIIVKNPMNSVPMIKRANFLAMQEKEDDEVVTIFTAEEIEKFKAECFRCWGNGKRIYQQSAAYILMLNTGLRTGELLGLLNSDIDLTAKTAPWALSKSDKNDRPSDPLGRSNFATQKTKKEQKSGGSTAAD